MTVLSSNTDRDANESFHFAICWPEGRVMTARSSLAFSAIDGVLLIAHGKQAPTDAEFDQLMDKSIALYKTHRFGRTIAISEGGAPTAAQRHRMDKRVREEITKTGDPQARIAILSHSPFVRAVVTASVMLESNWFTWISRNSDVARIYRAFVPSELPLAIAWLDIPANLEGRITAELERLRQMVSDG
jgi:hypothetical protein